MYYLLVQFVSIAVLFGMFGVNNSAVYFLGKKRMPQQELYGQIFLLAIFSSFAFFALTLVSRNFLSGSILRGVSTEHISLMALAIPLLTLNQISLSIILGLGRIMMYNILEITSYMLLFLNFLIFVVVFKKGIYGAYLSFAMTYFLMDCVYAFLLMRGLVLKIEWGKMKDVLHYGLRSFLGPICLLLIFKLDSFILNIFSNIRAVGFYSIAVSFAELLPFVPLAVGTVLFPKLTSQETARLHASTARVIRVMFSFLAFLCVIFLILGKRLILFVYGDIYSPSVIPLYILLPGYLFISFYYLFFSYFNAIDKPEMPTLVLIATLMIKVFASIFAVPRWGILGAATASSVSYFSCGLLFLIAFSLESKKSVRETFLIRGSDIKYLWSNLTNVPWLN